MSLTSYKRSFVSKMQEKMEQANVLFYQWDDIDRVLYNDSNVLKRAHGINKQCKHKTDKNEKDNKLNRTEPLRIYTVEIAKGNSAGCYEDSSSCHDNIDNRDKLDRVSKQKVTISLPIDQLVEEEICVTRKEKFPKIQIANIVQILSSSSYIISQPNEAILNMSDTNILQTGSTYCGNHCIKTLQLNCQISALTASNSNSSTRDLGGVTSTPHTHIPTSEWGKTGPVSTPRTHIPTREWGETGPTSTLSHSTASGNSRHGNFRPDSYRTKNPCHSSNGSDCIQDSYNTPDLVTDASTDSACATDASHTSSNFTTSDFSSVSRTSDLTGSEVSSTSRTSDLTGSEVSSTSRTSDLTGSSQCGRSNLSKAFSVSTSVPSGCGAVSDSRNILNALSAKCSEQPALLIDEEVRPLLATILPSITQTEQWEINGDTSLNNSFHNLIKSIDDLENKLGPESHEDLSFLRSILENDQLSSLHRVLKHAACRTQSLSAGSLDVEDVKTHEGDSEQTVHFPPLEQISDSERTYHFPPWQQEPEKEDGLVTIRFNKSPEQTLGAIILEDKISGAIIIEKILEESPLAACNMINPGDELKQINEVPVVGKSLEEVCGMLLQTCLVCTLTVSAIGNAPENLGIASKSRFFRAFFNYDPKKDSLHPYQGASFAFELGDILEVLNSEDMSWWQAKKHGTSSVGLIPSSEQRLRYLSGKSVKACSENLFYSLEHKKKKKKDCREKESQREPLTYLEVSRVMPSKKNRRPIILTGAKGYGGPCLRKRLLHFHPNKYFLPQRLTTKPDIKGYKVCSKKEYITLLKQGDLFEYSKVGSHYFGTSNESVRDLIVSGKICLLEVHPQYLPVLCNGTLRPHVIFIEATTEDRMKELKQTNPADLPQHQRKLHGSEIRELRFNSERLLRRYTRYVDTIITLESLSSAADIIDQVTDRIIEHPAWMPKKWMENS